MGGGKKKKNRKRSSKGEDKLPLQKQENAKTSKCVAESDAAFLDVSGASADLGSIEDRQTDLSTEKSNDTLSDDDCYNKKRSSSGGRKKANSAAENAGDDVNKDTFWSKRKPRSDTNDVSTTKLSDNENEDHFYNKKRSSSGGRLKNFGAERSRDCFGGQKKTDFSTEKSKNVENKDDTRSKRKSGSGNKYSKPIQKQQNAETSKFVAESDAAFLEVSGASADINIIEDQQTDLSMEKSNDALSDDCYNKKRSSSGGRKIANSATENARDDVNEVTIWSKSKLRSDTNDVSTKKLSDDENEGHFYNKKRSSSGGRMKNFGAERSSDRFWGQGKTDFSTEKSKNVENKDDTRSKRKSGSGNRYSSTFVDEYFQDFETEYNLLQSDCKVKFSKITEQVGDIFDVDRKYSLAHCVAEDLRMSSGIAVKFCEHFGRYELFKQNPETGNVIFLIQDYRVIYYLITKATSSGKPTYFTLFSSLYNMRKHMIENGIYKLAIPRIGCGLDRLSWPKVKYMLEFLFRDFEAIEILVCSLEGSPYRTQSLERYVRRYLREETDNPEFETFKKEICLDYGTSIVEKDVNLFEMPEDYSLAHCVAEDFNMGAGIAVQFRLKFRRVDELLQNHQKTGGLAVLNDKQRFIYYMVSKQFSYGKPTYYTLFLCLQKMAEHVEKHDVKHLAMPRIGCGLDKLDWKMVRKMIEFIFRDSDIEIVICDYQPPEDSTPQRLRNCKTVNVTYPIENIESGTIILFLLTQSRFVSEEMKALNRKFRIDDDYRNFRGCLGDIFYTERRNLNYNLCGCVVRQTEKDLIDFVALRKCLSDMQKKTKESDIGYVGFQAIKDNDPCTNHKIINLLKNTLRGFEVYVCWPGELEKLMPLSNREQSSSSQNDSSAKDSTKGPSTFFSKKDGGSSWRSNNI